MTSGSVASRRMTVLRDGPLLSLVATTGLIGVAGAMVITSTSLFLADAVHAIPLMIGLFVAGRAAAEIVTDLIVGVISDRIHSRQVLLALCSALSAAGALSYLLVRDFYLLLGLSALFFGIGGATFSQLFAYTREFAELRGIEVTFFNSALRAVTSVAWIVGPPLGLSLLAGSGFSLLYGVATGLYAVSAVLCLWGLPTVSRAAAEAKATETGVTETGVTETGATEAPAAVKPAGAWRRAFAGIDRGPTGLLLAAIVLMLTVNIMYQIDIALFVTKDLHFSAVFAGVLVGLASAVEVPVMLILGARAQRIGKWRLVLVATICATVFFALLPLATTQLELILLQVLNATWTAIILSIPVVILQDMLPDRAGAASALYSSAFKAGGFLGGAITGVVAAWAGFTHLFWVCAGLTVVATVLIAIGRRH